MAIKAKLAETEELESFVLSAVLDLICHCYPSPSCSELGSHRYPSGKQSVGNITRSVFTCQSSSACSLLPVLRVS